jgi:hypothetical protein
MAGSQGQLLRASGGFELNLGDFVYASGTLGFEKSATTITLANGSDVLVDSLTVGGSSLSGFVGVGGAYHVDSNGDGRITASDTPNAAARGFSPRSIPPCGICHAPPGPSMRRATKTRPSRFNSTMPTPRR